jgi:hypothetical protein
MTENEKRIYDYLTSQPQPVNTSIDKIRPKVKFKDKKKTWTPSRKGIYEALLRLHKKKFIKIVHPVKTRTIIYIKSI